MEREREDNGTNGVGSVNALENFLSEGVIVRAPGRVNLIGEHIDYNGGTVVPCAIPLWMFCFSKPLKEPLLSLSSTEMEEKFEGGLGEGDAVGNWYDYPIGVIRGLLRMTCGCDSIPGMEMVVRSSLPKGRGLSSSAALEACALLGYSYILEERAGVPFPSGKRGVDICHRAETEFVGMPCGRMDQTAVLLSKEGHVTVYDTSTDGISYVPFPSDWSIVVFDTGVSRSLRGSEYASRRRDCESIFNALKKHAPELKGLAFADLSFVRELVGDEKKIMRAEHVIGEQKRVKDFLRYLGERNEEGVGAAMKESHESLMNLYQVSCAELDAAVEAAARSPGCIGTRMTGAGFGGCTVSIVKKGEERAFVAEMEEKYHAKTGIKGKGYSVYPCSGASVVYPKEKALLHPAELWE